MHYNVILFVPFELYVIVILNHCKQHLHISISRC